MVVILTPIVLMVVGIPGFFFRKDHSFSRDLLHQQFQETIKFNGLKDLQGMYFPSFALEVQFLPNKVAGL